MTHTKEQKNEINCNKDTKPFERILFQHITRIYPFTFKNITHYRSDCYLFIYLFIY